MMKIKTRKRTSIRTMIIQITCMAIFIIIALSFVISKSQAAGSAIGMVTGPATGTYVAFGNDIANISKKAGQQIIIKTSNGSVENLKRITENGENAGLGIVQSDVLGFLKRSDNPNSKNVAKKLRMIAPFYQEEIHILARKDIASFADLAGKRIIIGQRGSGNMLTSMNLLTLLGVRPAKYMQLAPPEGIVAVLAGEADALIFVGGKPVPLFKNLEDIELASGGRNAHLLKKVHFVPLSSEKLMREYSKSSISADDYSFVTEDVPTVAVTAMLVSYDFSDSDGAYQKMRCKQIATISGAIQENMTYLRANGHPKWKQVNLARKIGGWKKDKCAWSASGLSPAPNVSSALEHDLLNIIKGKK